MGWKSVTTTTEDMTNDHPSETPESASKKKRRFLRAEKKFTVYLEAQSNDKAVGELLRREGLFSTGLARIRQQVKKGALVRLDIDGIDVLGRRIDSRESGAAVTLAFMKNSNDRNHPQGGALPC